MTMLQCVAARTATRVGSTPVGRPRQLSACRGGRFGPSRAQSSLRPSFAITAEQEELREAARAFATTELVGLAAELEHDNKPVPDEWRKRYRFCLFRKSYRWCFAVAD